MKPIEEGCTAIIVDGRVESNIGKIVTVGRFIGRKNGFEAHDLWKINKSLLHIFGDRHFMCSEKLMERIDDTDISQQTETSKKNTEKA